MRALPIDAPVDCFMSRLAEKGPRSLKAFCLHYKICDQNKFQGSDIKHSGMLMPRKVVPFEKDKGGVSTAASGRSVGAGKSALAPQTKELGGDFFG